MWGSQIGASELTLECLHPLVVVLGDKSLVDTVMEPPLLEGQRNKMRFAIQKNLISVNPPFFHVLNVVVNDKSVDCLNQLEVTDIGEEVELRYCELHRPFTTTVLRTYSITIRDLLAAHVFHAC